MGLNDTTPEQMPEEMRELAKFLTEGTALIDITVRHTYIHKDTHIYMLLPSTKLSLF